MSLWSDIADALGQATGKPFNFDKHEVASGGCINSTFVIHGTDERYFVKTNRAELLEMFLAESDGLEELAAAKAIRVPQPVCSGVSGDQAFLVLDHIPFSNQSNGAALGEALAKMHRCRQDRYGWYRDNTIGDTPQLNNYRDNWISFWREMRLEYQLELAAKNGYSELKQQAKPLLDNLERFFEDYTPPPSLLHGDLWSGNYAASKEGEPVIFDPAVYFGDRETDIAMTELFGGFGNDFYQAYNAAWPLDPGYKHRKTLYNLYHILNHANMFGSGYAGQAGSMIDVLLHSLD